MEPMDRGDVVSDTGLAGSGRHQNFPFDSNNTLSPSIHTSPPSSSQHYVQSSVAPSNPSSLLHAELPPLKPVFGVSLEELFSRDGSAVPMIVHQCLQAVDLFGLEVEGIYRTSGTASHITKLRTIFENGK